jgi:hypothetical protein
MTVTVAWEITAFLGSVILPVRDALVDCAPTAIENSKAKKRIGNTL